MNIKSLKHELKKTLYVLANRTIKIFFPINNKKILCRSFLGLSYSDNPRAISEKLNEMDPTWEIVWVFKDVQKNKKNAPSFIRCIKDNSLSFIFHQATAKYWIDNYCLSYETQKRKGQIYIHTWHGDRTIKKILNDSDKKKKNNLYETEHCDLAVAGSTFFTKVLHSAYGYNGKILLNGCPRNDILVNGNDSLAQSLKKQFGIPNNAKTLLYAPTFRDDIKEKNQRSKEVDLSEIINHLTQKTNQEWIILLRGHTGRNIILEKEVNIRTINVSEYEETNHLLLITDVLISDYSSIAGDFALRGKPVFMYISDLDDYLTNSRNLYYEFNETPYWYAKNQKELIGLIDSYTDESAKKNCEEILMFYGTKETGKASEEVCKYMFDKSK